MGGDDPLAARFDYNANALAITRSGDRVAHGLAALRECRASSSCDLLPVQRPSVQVVFDEIVPDTDVAADTV